VAVFIRATFQEYKFEVLDSGFWFGNFNDDMAPLHLWIYG
jgi:hypothetical protein